MTLRDKLKKDKSYEWSDIEAENKAAAYLLVVRQLKSMSEDAIPRPLLPFKFAHSGVESSTYLRQSNACFLAHL